MWQKILIILALLAVLAGGGYLALRWKNQPKNQFGNLAKVPNLAKPQPTTPKEYVDLTYPQATDTEKRFLELANKQSTSSGIPDPEMIDLAEKLATPSSSITVNLCKFSPYISKAQKNQAIIFINKDLVEHTITFNYQDYKIASGSDRAKVETSNLKVGVYRIKCDQPYLYGYLYLY